MPSEAHQQDARTDTPDCLSEPRVIRAHTAMRIERIGNATLYLGDCRDVLPTLGNGNVHSIITDPPYGTGWVRGGKRAGEFEPKHERPMWDVFDISWVKRVCENPLIATFCPASRLSETCAEFATPCVARYRKTNVRPGGNELEFIVASEPWRGRVWEIEAYNADAPFHPCQKPNLVMDWIIDNLRVGGVVVDPFMGSGSTGVACLKFNRFFIGIESDPQHFQTACERIENAQRQQSLLDPYEANQRSYEQTEML